MEILKAILSIFQAGKTTDKCNSNDSSSNNACCYNSSQKLLLIHLPNEILSMIILELLNEWCLLKYTDDRYTRGLLDSLQILPELSTNHMIPLTQVNKFFIVLCGL